MSIHILILAAGLLASFPAQAITIAYASVDLPDVTLGQDLYRYDYLLDEFPYDADFGFSVLFDPALYASLESPPSAVGSEWDIISLQPDVALPADGLYDALALVNSPLALSGFSVEFVWLGGGTPGVQPFVVYDTSFAPVEVGQTIPEPGTALSLLLGLCMIAVARPVGLQSNEGSNT